MRGSVMPVLGHINPDQLSPTLMHEHILMDLAPPRLRAEAADENETTLCTCWQINYSQKPSRTNLTLSNKVVARPEIAVMHAAGGRFIAELTVGGLDPRPESLAELSGETGVHIVMGRGYYVSEFQPESHQSRSVDDFARKMVE
jgi:phosphotriesterase-related protein